MTKRQRQAVETKLRIQEKALELFEQKGFENVSMEQIARAAGCSAGNIYNYFGSKEMLALKLMDHVDQIYDELAPEYLETGSGPAAERLLDFFCRALETSCREPLLWQCFIHSLKYPQQEILKIRYDRTFFSMLRQLAAESRSEENLRGADSPEEIVQHLTVIFRGALIQWRLEGGSSDVCEAGRKLAKAYLDSLK
ncbi:MAG: TetR/AcrR family transcriptional regulator [Emergencia sp.]